MVVAGEDGCCDDRGRENDCCVELGKSKLSYLYSSLPRLLCLLYLRPERIGASQSRQDGPCNTKDLTQSKVASYVQLPHRYKKKMLFSTHSSPPHKISYLSLFSRENRSFVVEGRLGWATRRGVKKEKVWPHHIFQLWTLKETKW